MAKKILIVEDNNDIRHALRLLIEFNGYQVVEAVHGYEAYERAQQHIPDLILMDLAMPIFDGVDATRQIRAYPEIAHIPIIAVTSHGNRYEAEAIAAGCNQVLSKKNFMDDFESILKKYLHR